jgi:quercetin dioxygenase-like cupin family protein
MQNQARLAQIRRVVAAERDDGASYVGADGPPPQIMDRLAPLWATDHGRTTLPIRTLDDDPALDFRKFFGGPGDTRLCAVLIPPLTASSTEGLDIDFRPAGKHSGDGWHATYSVDYVIIMSGEIDLALDEAEVRLHAGDVVVLGGVSHVWRNRSDQPCLMYSVIVGAPDGDA